jgi:hypothetical protein
MTIDLPEALRAIRTRPLFVMRLSVKPMLAVGETPNGVRKIALVTGGSFEGERLSGEVLDGGSDWQTVRKDGSTLLDVRLTLKTNDGELLNLTYRGMRHGPPEIIERMSRGEEVDPTSYYFRTVLQFETASSKLAWINNIVAVGTGHRTASGPVYNIFEIL